MKEYIRLADIQRDIEARLLSCSDLVEFYIANIKKQEHLNIFLEVFENEARERARKIDRKIQSGEAGRLAGLVIGI